MTEPTDAELDELRQANSGRLNFVTFSEFRTIARAVLEKWGQPAHGGKREPLGQDDSRYVESLERFAALVAAKEREACAVLVESEWSTDSEKTYGDELASFIRARGAA